jgi:CDGSH-type Zn-finger protein
MPDAQMPDARMPDGVPEIVAYPDGPFLVRGDFAILGANGESIPKAREVVALCRCGASTIKPYCDGTHKLINFRAD